MENNLVKEYLESLEYYPDEHELDRIIALSLKQDAFESNKGIRFERTEHNPREKAFYEQWLKENEPTPHAIAAWFIENFIITRNP